MIEPLNVVGALRRSWRLLVALAVVFGIVALLIPTSHAKVTGGKDRLKWKVAAVVGAPPTSALGNVTTSVSTILFYANNFFIKGNAVAASGQKEDLTKVAPFMSGTASSLGTTTGTTKPTRKAGSSPVVTLTASGSTPQRAAALADAYVTAVGNAVNDAFQAREAQLGVSTTGLSSGYGVLVPGFAGTAVKINATKSSLGSSKKVRLLIGILVGLLLAVAIVLVREFLDRRVRSAGRAERIFRYPVIAEIPGRPLHELALPRSPVDVVGEPESSAAEAYRMLRMSVLFEAMAAGPPALDEYNEGLTGWQLPAADPYQPPEPGTRKVIMVVSAANESTRPEVAANLGATYAEAGQRAIVISTADIASGYARPGRPIQTGPFTPGDLAAHLEPSSLPNVSRLSLRHFVASSGQLVMFGSELLNAARQLADVIIVETPPLLVVHHGEALVQSVDVVLVVAECGSTTIDEGHRAGDILRRLGAPVLGLVLTKVTLPKNDIRQLQPMVLRPALPELEAAVAGPVPEVSQA